MHGFSHHPDNHNHLMLKVTDLILDKKADTPTPLQEDLAIKIKKLVQWSQLETRLSIHWFTLKTLPFFYSLYTNQNTPSIVLPPPQS